MGRFFAWRKRRRSPLDAAEMRRFRKFILAKSRPAMTLLTFTMPFLFAVGWARDLAVLGASARWTLLLRLALVIALLIAAWLLRSTRSGWRVQGFGMLYTFVFGIAIAATTAIEPSRLSMTHVG